MAPGYRPESARWYNQTCLVLLLCVLVLPLGCYGLWQSRMIPPPVKAFLVGVSIYLHYILARAVLNSF